MEYASFGSLDTVQTVLSSAFAYNYTFWNLQSLESGLPAEILAHLFHVTFVRLPCTGTSSVAGDLTCLIQKVSRLAQQNTSLSLKTSGAVSDLTQFQRDTSYTC